MSTSDRPSILVPFRVLEGEQIEPGIDTLLANAHVVLLGYHELPEQTPTGQARMQYEDRAMDRLGDLAERLEGAGARVDTRLVFTHDRDQTLDRIADEEDCVATVLPNPAAAMDDVLILLRGDLALDRIVTVAGGLFADSDVAITLFHVETDEAADASDLLDRARTELVDRGVDADRIDTHIESASRPMKAMMTASEGYDAVIMGESDPTVVTFIFGESSAQVADRFMGPVLVVRRVENAEKEAEADSGNDGGEDSGEPDA